MVLHNTTTAEVLEGNAKIIMHALDSMQRRRELTCHIDVYAGSYETVSFKSTKPMFSINITEEE